MSYVLFFSYCCLLGFYANVYNLRYIKYICLSCLKCLYFLIKVLRTEAQHSVQRKKVQQRVSFGDAVSSRSQQQWKTENITEKGKLSTAGFLHSICNSGSNLIIVPALQNNLVLSQEELYVCMWITFSNSSCRQTNCIFGKTITCCTQKQIHCVKM